MNLGKGALVLSLLLLAGSLWADTYQIDKGHSSVGFTTRHIMINKVHGYFTDFSGTVEYDPKDITKSTVNGTIKVSSITTNNDNRDSDLKSADGFFEVAKFPDITFVSKKVVKKADGYVCLGTLTIHGVSKDVELPFTVTGPIKGPGGFPRIAIEASTTVSRKDFGLTWDNKLEDGTLIVANDVKIEINAEAVNRPAK